VLPGILCQLPGQLPGLGWTTNNDFVQHRGASDGTAAKIESTLC